jgi:hypothetical protein
MYLINESWKYALYLALGKIHLLMTLQPWIDNHMTNLWIDVGWDLTCSYKAWCNQTFLYLSKVEGKKDDNHNGKFNQVHQNQIAPIYRFVMQGISIWKRQEVFSNNMGCHTVQWRIGEAFQRSPHKSAHQTSSQFGLLSKLFITFLHKRLKTVCMPINISWLKK